MTTAKGKMTPERYTYLPPLECVPLAFISVILFYFYIVVLYEGLFPNHQPA